MPGTLFRAFNVLSHLTLPKTSKVVTHFISEKTEAESNAHGYRAMKQWGWLGQSGPTARDLSLTANIAIISSGKSGGAAWITEKQLNTWLLSACYRQA